MIDHYTLLVSDYERAKAFYLAALKPLGYELVMEITREQMPDLPFEKGCGMGPEGKPCLWLRPSDSIAPTHIAFLAPNHQSVQAFHAAALAAGAKDHGGPGLRPHYHPNYYAAFVLDADGYNIEAVCHTPQG
jgi:catechol 2,3-dioxygenase-like lactoylglutathione lyase family enzyme